MSECKGCGSPTKNCGAPIWEDVCTNKGCTYDADQFKVQMREQGIRMRKEKELRDAAPELYEALEWCLEFIDSNYELLGDQLSPRHQAQIALSKARGEHK